MATGTNIAALLADILGNRTQQPSSDNQEVQQDTAPAAPDTTTATPAAGDVTLVSNNTPTSMPAPPPQAAQASLPPVAPYDPWMTPANQNPMIRGMVQPTSKADFLPPGYHSGPSLLNLALSGGAGDLAQKIATLQNADTAQNSTFVNAMRSYYDAAQKPYELGLQATVAQGQNQIAQSKLVMDGQKAVQALFDKLPAGSESRQILSQAVSQMGAMAYTPMGMQKIYALMGSGAIPTADQKVVAETFKDFMQGGEAGGRTTELNLGNAAGLPQARADEARSAAFRALTEGQNIQTGKTSVAQDGTIVRTLPWQNGVPQGMEITLPNSGQIVRFDSRGQIVASPTTASAINVPAGTIAANHNNPGNLKYVGQADAVQGAPAGDGTFYAKFPTADAGYAALQQQIQTDANRGMTVGQYAHKYATDPNYLTKVAMAMGVAPAVIANMPLAMLNPDRLAQAQAKVESGTTVAAPNQATIMQNDLAARRNSTGLGESQKADVAINTKDMETIRADVQKAVLDKQTLSQLAANLQGPNAAATLPSTLLSAAQLLSSFAPGLVTDQEKEQIANETIDQKLINNLILHVTQSLPAGQRILKTEFEVFTKSNPDVATNRNTQLKLVNLLNDYADQTINAGKATESEYMSNPNHASIPVKSLYNKHLQEETFDSQARRQAITIDGKQYFTNHAGKVMEIQP